MREPRVTFLPSYYGMPWSLPYARFHLKNNKKPSGCVLSILHNFRNANFYEISQPGSINTEQDSLWWVKVRENLKDWSFVLTGLQGHAEFMRSGWFCISWLMLGLNFWKGCFALYSSLHPIPLLLFLPCSFINHSFLLPLIIFLTFVLLSTYFLHVWLFQSVPLVLCSSFSPFYSSSYVFLQSVHLLQVVFFITYLWLWMSLSCPHLQLLRHFPLDWFLAQ